MCQSSQPVGIDAMGVENLYGDWHWWQIIWVTFALFECRLLWLMIMCWKGRRCR